MKSTYYKKFASLFNKNQKETDLPDFNSNYIPPFLEKGNETNDALLRSIVFMDILTLNMSFKDRSTLIQSLANDTDKNKEIEKLQNFYLDLIQAVPADKREEFMQATQTVASTIDKTIHFKNAKGQINNYLTDKQNELNSNAKTNEPIEIMNDSLANYFKQQRKSKELDTVKTTLTQAKFAIKEALGQDNKSLIYKEVWDPLFKESQNQIRMHRLISTNKKNKYEGIDFEWLKKACEQDKRYPKHSDEIDQLWKEKFSFDELGKREIVSKGTTHQMDTEDITIHQSFYLSDQYNNNEGTLKQIKQEFNNQYEKRGLDTKLETLKKLQNDIQTIEKEMDPKNLGPTIEKLDQVQKKLDSVFNVEPQSQLRTTP